MMKTKNEKALFNAVIALFDDNIYQYKGLDNPDWIKYVCEKLDITEEEYKDIVFSDSKDSEPCRALDTPEKLLKGVSEEMQDGIYRYLWAKHVKEDVISYSEENDIELTEEQVTSAILLYVYEGRYDCNLSYWSNIANLISEVVNK